MLEATGRLGGDMTYTFTPPTLAEAFCPEVGWTVTREGFCYDCGATDHEG